jgi:D-alanyl-D-alanine carboxypeptidase
MSRIQSYTGYVKCNSGKWVSFAIIANGFDVNGSIIRSKMQKIILEIHKGL